MIQRAYLAGRPSIRGLDEMDGFAELGMYAEALRAAQDFLQHPVVSAESFEASVNMVLSGADDLVSWENTIRFAYQRLNAGARRRNAYLMLWFYAACEDHTRAAGFIPEKFSGRFALVNLLFAMSTYLGLKRLDKAQRLIPRCKRAARVAGTPEMRKMLSEALESYHCDVERLRADQSGCEK